ncbi:hypothetical protein ACSU64_27675 [Bacillaceae bacterium C204]|uniref:hypothetical protein n=1 Tax=Neobacillus sp. 204 TaxID=3383351 RepID=UPI00397BF774
MDRLELIKRSISHGIIKFEDMDWLVEQVEVLRKQVNELQNVNKNININVDFRKG